MIRESKLVNRDLLVWLNPAFGQGPAEDSQRLGHPGFQGGEVQAPDGGFQGGMIDLRREGQRNIGIGDEAAGGRLGSFNGADYLFRADRGTAQVKSLCPLDGA